MGRKNKQASASQQQPGQSQPGGSQPGGSQPGGSQSAGPQPAANKGSKKQQQAEKKTQDNSKKSNVPFESRQQFAKTESKPEGGQWVASAWKQESSQTLAQATVKQTASQQEQGQSQPSGSQPTPGANKGPRRQQQKQEKKTPDDSKKSNVPFESRQQFASPESNPQSGQWVASAWLPKQESIQSSTQANIKQTPKSAEQPISSQQAPRGNKGSRKQPTSLPVVESPVVESPIAELANLSLTESRSSSVASSSRSSTSAANIPTSALIPVAPNKGCGTRGRKIVVDVNFLPLIIDKLLPTVYQYDVTIEPNMPKRLLPHIFEAYRTKNFSRTCIAFDGQKIAVSPKILPINEKIEKQTKVIDENGRERVYMVSMKEARDSKINFGSLKNYTTMRQYDAPLRAIQMLEIVLKAPFLNKNGVQAGRSFYMPLSRPYDLGDNYELWTGLYQSTVLGLRPYLNVDIAHKAFPSQRKIIDIVKEIRGVNMRNGLDLRAQNELQSHLKGLMISYSMSGQDASRRTYKFLGLNANSETFKFKNDQDKKECTIASYFNSRGVRIQFPLLPTLKLGNSIKNITVPMEFCTVAGYQAVNKKCTEMQTRNMIKVAATSTDVRRQKIMDMLRQISHNQSATLQEFGITVGNEFTKAPARVLSAPTLQYKNEKTVVPAKGQWRVDNLQFLLPKMLTRYAVLVTDRYADDSQVRDFCYSISRYGNAIGMQIDPECDIYRVDSNSRNIKNDMITRMSQMVVKNIELLFCIIPDRGDTYGKVKQCAELDCGILTQCIKTFTLSRKGNDQSTITNILLKVNAKLNGTNHKFAPVSLLPMMRKPFMLIGADVTHPSPGQENIPSVVGVVSSHDVYGFKYNKCWRLQDPKQEMISNFDEILKEHLKFFEKQNNRLPDVIMYFRDGVSEGQFQEVLTGELNAMYRGCQQYKSEYKPKITFIVVQKRHHTRFFPPANSDLGRDDRKNNNVPPGTIVDSEITHPNECQFYLVSHQSIQGVARPTKYCLLRDDSDFPIDDLEAITYNLCHFFARCTRSVSYPAPTYYAHLAASRGRVYIEGAQINMSKLDMEFKRRTVKETIDKGHPMYFI